MRFVVTALVGFVLCSVAAAAEKHNVLLLMADDFRDFGGSFTPDVVKTPNLDRLRSRGTTFERAYVQYPVCNPSRSSLMTGLRPEQTGIVDNNTRLREKLPHVVTLPQLFKQAGWQTHAFGKLFHIGGGKNEDLKRAWADTNLSWHSAETFNATSAGSKLLEGRNLSGDKLKWCAWGMSAGTDEDQPDGQIAAATIRQIEKLGDRPWFIGCGFMKPHDPFIAPKKYFDLYPLQSIQPWKEPAQATAVRSASVGFGTYGEVFGQFTQPDWRELMRAYLACTSYMDAQLGLILDLLDRRQLWDRTLVVFIGDHGYHTGERLWWNKNTLFERSCRAPLIMAAPKMPGGQTSRSLVEFIDLYPTVAAHCGLDLPHAMPGRDLHPILRQSQARVKDAAFTMLVRNPQLQGQSVRTTRWRFNQWSDGHGELFDLENDPEELVEVSKDHPALVEELRNLITQQSRTP